MLIFLNTVITFTFTLKCCVVLNQCYYFKLDFEQKSLVISKFNRLVAVKEH